MRRTIYMLAIITVPATILLGNIMQNTIPTVNLIPAVAICESICGLTPSENEAELSESLISNGQELPRTS